MCFLHDNNSSKLTPRFLATLTLSKISFSIFRSFKTILSSFFNAGLLPKNINLVLPAFKVKKLSLQYVLILSKTLFALSMVSFTSSTLVSNNKSVSSAYWWYVPSQIWHRISETKIVNSNGPNIDPWGTPFTMCIQSDASSPTTTLWYLLDK